MNARANQDAGAGPASAKSCMVGFVLSVVLTASAFALVMNSAILSRTTVVAGIVGAAVLQIMVHLHVFLHLDRSSSARWNLMALLFTAAIMLLFVGGSLWIMFDLYGRMM